MNKKDCNMKVCLINFPFTEDRFMGREYGKFEQYEQNISLAYIASYLEQNGINTEIIECVPRRYGISELIENVKREKYDAIVLAVEEYTFLNVVRFLKKIGEETCLIFAGMYSALNYKKILTSYRKNSFCLLANQEAACLGIIQYLQGKTERDLLKNVAYYDDTVVKKEVSDGIEFSNLPLPKRVFVSPNGMAGIESTRGCNNNCIYCTANVARRSIQYKCINDLMLEMTELIEQHGVKYIRFHDENFLINSKVNRKRLNDFCEELEKRGWDIKFKIFARAVDIIANQDLLIRLKKVGLDSVFIGIESFIQRQLDFYRKNTTVQQNKEAIEILRSNNITYTMGFLPLDPFVTLDELEINLETVKEIKYSSVDAFANLPISCIPSLSILQGSDFQKIICQENLNANNDLGYRFIYTGINEFYKLKEYWSNKVMQVHSMNYLIGMAEQRKGSVLVNQLKQAKAELMELDLDVLLNIVAKIKKHDNKRVCIDKNFLNELRRIEIVFCNAKENLLSDGG